jgi:hypothetical protein
MNWDDLRQMRRQGLRPKLPVIVTVHEDRLARTLSAEGCGVIVVKSGEPFHVELLEGLRVWLFLGNCDRAQAVVRALNAKGVQLAELQSWCECEKSFSAQPVRCQVAMDWAA